MDFLILTLAVWRIGSLLTNDEEHGPYDILDRLRYWVGVQYDEKNKAYGKNELAKLFTCIWCTSVWLGLIAATGYYLFPFWAVAVALPFALSGGAIVVDRWING